MDSDIWFADSKYGEVLPHPHAQAQTVQGAMDLKKRPEAGNQSQAETGKLNQVNLEYSDFLSASFGHGWKANICLKRKLLSILSCVMFEFLLFQAKFRQEGGQRRNKRKVPSIGAEVMKQEGKHLFYSLIFNTQWDLMFDLGI